MPTVFDTHTAGHFLANLFARDTFAAHLLERSFDQPIGWVEAAVTLLLMAATYFLSEYLIRRNAAGKPHGGLRHIGNRLLWPVMMLFASVASLYIWNLLELHSVWLRLLIMAARWMILIRLLLALVHAALPPHKTTDWLERFLAGMLWVCFLIWVSGIDDLLLETLKNTKLTMGSASLSLYMILTGLMWIALVVTFAMWLARQTENWLMKNNHMDINLRIMMSKIIKALLLVVAVLVALPLIGIDLTVLSVFGGALGVGIGFGLQKVASNYISGFIILGDRSIRPGDRLTVNNFTGYVTKITARFVVLRSSKGGEALIPNETFITSTVINESYTAKSLWQSLDIQVAYHTDLTLAMQIMVEAAQAQERVQNDPAPKAYLTNFGENGVDLRLGFWVTDPENGFAGLFSNILLDIWKRFNENHIEFPYPQREVRILQEERAPDDTAISRAAAEIKRDTRSDRRFDDTEQEN
ncbi:mechanosensitive ion channel family protein [Neisseria lisongii]|uniref:Mechanosensitive ion channel n=1 Tax=Neisseria lisongii TaxID=2912188 RepID=A0AAW5AI23_9NEIS|nr:mechanosensitive ion channel domain-containing protein [Neisseria lisongii]MCF7529271.1 mechanosensitive ion channel [Neisseria lisongii]